MENEQAYWTYEVAERLKIGDSTLRKWSIELERAGYVFVKGNGESRAYTERDIFILLKIQTELKKQGSKKSIKRAIERALSDEESGQAGGVLPAAAEETTPLESTQEAQERFLKLIKEQVKAELQTELQAQEQRQIERENAREERLHMRLENHDQLLMTYIRERQAEREAAAAIQKRWWQFWK